MARSSAEILIDSLIEWGVEVVFGLPGDGINGIMEALRKNQDKIRFVQVRHEESAAFMATGYAKYTGKLGVCLATSGPGGIHLLNGLYDAKLDGQPVLALTGLQFHDLINTWTQQDVNLDRLFEDVADYNVRVMGPTHVENVVNAAVRSSISHRSVSHITIPVDVQDMEISESERSKRNKPKHNSYVFNPGKRIPAKEELQQAAGILKDGKKIAILAGRGALKCTDELEALAEKLAAPIVKPLLGKACVPDDSPYTTGSVGLLGTAPSQEVMENCDTLLMVGTSFPYIEFYPKPGQARAIQIDNNPTRIGLRYKIECGLLGDAQITLKSLLELCEPNKSRSFLEKAQKNMKDWNDILQSRIDVKDKPMKPQIVASELGKRLSSNAIVSCDSGTITTWWARHIPAQRGQMHSLSGTLATMACGLPYAISSQIAYPERQCIAFVGDGGFTMLMGELATCVKYKLPVKIFVIKNNTLGQIKWEQMVFLGNPEYGVELQSIDFAAFARSFGAAGFSVDDPNACGDVVEQALNTDGPVVVEAIVDPFEPPMPPKIKMDQAKKFAESLIRGEPHRNKIALTAASDKVREMI